PGTGTHPAILSHQRPTSPQDLPTRSGAPRKTGPLAFRPGPRRVRRSPSQNPRISFAALRQGSAIFAITGGNLRGPPTTAGVLFHSRIFAGSRRSLQSVHRAPPRSVRASARLTSLHSQ